MSDMFCFQCQQTAGGSGCVRTAAVIAVMCKPLTLLPAVRTAAKRMPDARLF